MYIKPANDANADSDTIKSDWIMNYQAVATYGQGLTDGIELALEEINGSGGVLGKQIEAVKVDNKSEDTESANVSTRLLLEIMWLLY